MKTKMYTQFLLVVFLASATGVMAQTKTEKEVKSEEAQKKAQVTVSVDGKKLTEEALKKELEAVRSINEKELKKMQENRSFQEDAIRLNREAVQIHRKSLEDLKEKGFDNYVVVPDVTPRTVDFYNQFGQAYNSVWSNRENSSLSISKALSDVTFATDFTYEVKEGNFTISFDVNGTLGAGELKIIMKKPDGKSFQEITMSSLADVNWNQTFRWEEDDQDEFLGKWTISIKADKAKGNYSVRVNSR